MTENDERDWQPVLLLHINPPYQPHWYVKRAYLAEHPDGIIMAGWDVPPAERERRAQLVGWKPDQPLTLPICFHPKTRAGTLIPRGTWVLPYDADHYALYQVIGGGLYALNKRIHNDPIAPDLLDQLTRLLTHITNEDN